MFINSMQRFYVFLNYENSFNFKMYFHKICLIKLQTKHFLIKFFTSNFTRHSKTRFKANFIHLKSFFRSFEFSQPRQSITLKKLIRLNEEKYILFIGKSSFPLIFEKY